MILRAALERSLQYCLLALAIVAGSAFAEMPNDATPEAAEQSATATVERFHAYLLSAMRSVDLDVAGRKEMLREVLASSFDVAAIARVSLGRHWRTLEAEQREQVESTLFELILTTYAARFDGYSGERFVTVGMGKASAGQMLLRTRIERSGGDPVRLDYLLRDTDDGPRILNVIANGFSDLSVRRAEYTSIVERRGFEGLIVEMERLIERNLREGAA